VDFPTDFPTGRRGGAERLAAGRAAAGQDQALAKDRESVGRLEGIGVYMGYAGIIDDNAAYCRAAGGGSASSPGQAAWYLNVKTSWVYEAVRTGRLPCHRVGRHIRFTRPMLDEWLAER
jgi:excisionase family DNA binding protein